MPFYYFNTSGLLSSFLKGKFFLYSLENFVGYFYCLGKESWGGWKLSKTYWLFEYSSFCFSIKSPSVESRYSASFSSISLYYSLSSSLPASTSLRLVATLSNYNILDECTLLSIDFLILVLLLSLEGIIREILSNLDELRSSSFILSFFMGNKNLSIFLVKFSAVSSVPALLDGAVSK